MTVPQQNSEDCYTLLNQWIESLFKHLEKYVQKERETLKKINSLIQQLKYSYYDENYFKEILNQLKEEVKKLKDAKTSEYGKKFIEYFIEEVEDLERKYKICPKEPYQIFRYDIVEILSVSKHPEYDNLFVVRAKGKKIYTIITNIKNVKERERRPVVLLPPKEFGSIISEAMFITEYPIKDINDIKIEDLKKLNSYYFEIVRS